MNKHELRAKYRKLRSALTEQQQLIAANNLLNNLISLPEIQTAQHIAGYWPNDKEISPLLFMEKMLSLGKNCYLPLIMGDKSLLLDFASYKLDSNMKKNKYGIYEPTENLSQTLTEKLELLNVILTPLVAFDTNGNRLGMGAGYYDATLSKLIDIEFEKRPVIIGLAHSLQEAETLPSAEWDWSLNIVVTDEKVIRINPEYKADDVTNI